MVDKRLDTLRNAGKGTITSLAAMSVPRFAISVANSYEGKLSLIGLWDIDDGRCLGYYDNSSKECRAIAVSPGDRLVVAGFTDGAVRVWDVATGRLAKILRPTGRMIDQLGVSPDGRTVVVFSASGSIHKIDLLSESSEPILDIKDSIDEPRDNFVTHRDSIGATLDQIPFAFSPDGSRLISKFHDRELRVVMLRGHEDDLACCFESPLNAVSTAGDIVIAGDKRGDLFFLKMASVELRQATTTLEYGMEIATCPLCWRDVTVPAIAIRKIQDYEKESGSLHSPFGFLTLGERAWGDSDLLTTCYHCRHELRINPFFGLNASQVANPA
jgi:hypothetical protein